MNFSFWEQDSWFGDIDYTIVGSGITGLNCALRIREKEPGAKVLIIEKGMLPEGASTKNAGFACFGSISEILDDLKSHSKSEVLELVQKRVKGLELLRKNLGDKLIDYKAYGGYELFTPEDKDLYEESIDRIFEVNKLLNPVFKEEVFSLADNKFGFKNIQPKLIYSKFEGQIDTGKMMQELLRLTIKEGVRVLNSVELLKYEQKGELLRLETNKFTISSKKLIIATNGFAKRLGIDEVKPARAQVLITKPLDKLPFQGTFHLDKGFYYFRNIGNRILFGGGRNLDFEAEETDHLGLTDIIQNKLKELLKKTILPTTAFEIEHSWSGIMGVGQQKKPIIKKLSKNVFCGVRLGGMGIAIGSQVGKDLADLALEL